MNIDLATFEIRPRKISEIMDLAFTFYRTHLTLLLQLTLITGIPNILTTMGIHYITDSAWAAILAFYLLCPLSHFAIIVAASRLVFGDNLSIKQTFKAYRPFGFSLFFRGLGNNLSFLATAPIFVGFFIKLSWLYTPMIVMLEQLSGRELAFRRRGLNRRNRGTSVGTLSLLVYAFSTVVTLSLVTIFELIFGDILNLWVDFGLFHEMVLESPLKLSLWFISILLVLPLNSLCIFFHYLDARIRGEGWDIELGFKASANTLNTLSGNPNEN